MRKSFLILALALLVVSFALPGAAKSKMSLWDVYENFFVNAKYVDLSHTITPYMPIWEGFGQPEFYPTKCGVSNMGEWAHKGDVFNYKDHGFCCNAYFLPTDQMGTQLDVPAHFNPYGTTVEKIPATYVIRPLVVVDVHEQTAKEPDYQCQVKDIKAWEAEHGTIPEGSVVMIRSDHSKTWDNRKEFEAHLPGVSLEAVKYLHETRHVLFHGHECLDTDTTSNFASEAWILKQNYCQAEGVSDLWKVPATGALIAVGFPKFLGGTGCYVRYIAICPPDWKYGESIAENPGFPLPSFDKPLYYDKEKGYRVR